MSALPAVPAQVAWYDTGNHVFPYAARVEGRWLVLRLNDFPEHPLLTLFIDARVIADVDDAPTGWRLPPRSVLPVLGAPERAQVLAAMAGLGPYGAEAGAPCTGDWCTCSILTDAYVTRPALPPRPAPDQG
ncbi:hypothetical protein ACFWAR_01885 [Streptomyces sp. NPDC059917]|uniref:hypothetical protein n=1 Tax=Streptomyces sp. NPDC059917 TaxID=3347002 RepID=UPI00365904F3